MAEAEQLNLAIHRAVGKRLSNILSYPLGKGDEGGWAPGITDEEALLVVSEEVGACRTTGEEDNGWGSTSPRGSLYDEKKGGYYYRSTGRTLSREQQIAFIGEIRDKFNLMYIEDPLTEDDFEGYAKLHSSLKNTLIVGDDLYTTDPERLKLGIESETHQRRHSQGEPDRHAR